MSDYLQGAPIGDPDEFEIGADRVVEVVHDALGTLADMTEGQVVTRWYGHFIVRRPGFADVTVVIS